MKTLLSRIAAGSVATVAVFAGFSASMASAAPYSTEGPNSPVWSFKKTYKQTNLANKTNVYAKNNTYQRASSGDVKAFNNTTVGDATSGDASNAASFSATVSVDNTSSSAAALSGSNGGSGGTGAISTEGPNSPIKAVDVYVEKTNVYNKTNIAVSNNTVQSASTGDVWAANNTTVGDVSSGDASNTSTSSMNISVSN